jgi:hypothetical protein
VTRGSGDRLTALEAEALAGAIREHYLPLRERPSEEYQPSLVRYVIMLEFMISERTFWAWVKRVGGVVGES